MPILSNTNTVFDAGSAGQTRTGLSTQIVIMVNGNPVGAIQSFGQTQQRSTRPITEVGTDGVIEIVPSSATQISLSIQRMVFDGLSLPEAFSRGFVNIAAQRMPFDIVVIDRSHITPDAVVNGTDLTGNEGEIVTVYKNCWFTNLSKTFSSQDYIISETASVSCETVYTQNSAGGALGGLGGQLRTDSNPQLDSSGYEQIVDSGAQQDVTRGGMGSGGVPASEYS